MKLDMRYLFSVAALLASGLLSGCANSAYEGRFAWEDGWRKGAISAVGEGVVFAEMLAKNCKEAPSVQLQSARYATIQYRKNSRPVWLTVPISADSSLKVNDLVYVNVIDCSNQVERRPG